MKIEDFDNYEMSDLFRSENMLNNKRKAFNISFCLQEGELFFFVRSFDKSDFSSKTVERSFVSLEEAIEYYNSLT